MSASFFSVDVLVSTKLYTTPVCTVFEHVHLHRLMILIMAQEDEKIIASTDRRETGQFSQLFQHGSGAHAEDGRTARRSFGQGAESAVDVQSGASPPAWSTGRDRLT